MQRIKKLLLATCLFWAGASQVARADQNINYIYKEKGQLVVHLGNMRLLRSCWSLTVLKRFL